MSKSGMCGFGVYPVDEKTTRELDAMIKRIAYGRKNTYIADPEDVIAECWIACLEVIEKNHSVDYGLLSIVCIRKIADIVRKSIAKEHMPTDIRMFDRCITQEQKQSMSAYSNEFTTYSYCSIQRQKAVEEDLEVNEILEMFDAKTEEKERKFVESWMKILGIKEAQKDEVIPDKAYDRFIAVDVLGYAGSSSCGYARLRLKVRKKLIANGYRVK